jgi:hypothetical protein
MKCQEARAYMETVEGRGAPEVLRHAETCAECRRYLASLKLSQGGLKLLAHEPPPEPSLGFAQRLVRQLDSPETRRRLGEEVLVRAGRRFALASLLAMLLVLMGLVLPSNSPMRGPGSAESYLAPQPQMATLREDPLFPDTAATNVSRVSVPDNEGGK